MKMLCALLITALCPFGAYAGDDQEAKLWVDGKVTPEQPFKAKVVAAGGLSPWSGETVIYLREDTEDGRHLRVNIGLGVAGGVRYAPIKNKEEFDKVVEGLRWYGAAVFIDPVEVTRFVWASPMGRVGQIFGDEDLVKKAYENQLKEAEQEVEE